MSDLSLADHIERLLSISEAEQQAYLDALRTGDRSLAERLARLLAGKPEAENYLNKMTSHIGEAMPAEVDEAWASGKRIGPYRLTSILGVGGMGSVFRAERADGSFDREVALKIVPLDLGNPLIVERFNNERRVLASLQHPNIAQLLDAGVTEDGRPYFVMEYVLGVPLDRYSDSHKLGIKQRLTLMTQIFDAVQFAHQKLVIHRDLKPGNILVTADGQVKLLDFGIAKLTDENRDSFTEPEARWMTPAFAAPEQTQDTTPTTAIDVYSLGVLLFQQLTGSLPTGGRSTSPRLPSAEVTHLDVNGQNEAAVNRGQSVNGLLRRLRGDLDVITSKAMAHQPDDRYRDVAALREDIQRHLDGLAIRAQPSPPGMRLAKFLRRNKAKVVVTTLVFLTITAFASYAFIQAHQARMERDRAQRISELLAEVFSGADPEQTRGRKLSAKYLLDSGLNAVLNQTSENPAVRTTLLRSIGRSYLSLGEYEQAATLLDKAVSIGEKNALPGLAESLQFLGEAQMLNGDLEAAIATLSKGLETATGSRGKRALLTLTIQGKLGRAMERAGRTQKAHALLSDAVDQTRRFHTNNGVALAQALNDLAAVAMTQGNYIEVEPLLHEAIKLNRVNDQRTSANPESPTASPRTATLINNLGLVVNFQGRQAEAEALYRESLAIRRRILDADHPDLAQSLTNLGLLLNELGQLQESAATLQEALSTRRASLPAGHIQIVSGMNNLAMVLQASHNYSRAEALYTEALLGLTESLGEEHPAVATTQSNLASVLFDLGRLTEAEAQFRRSLERRRELHPRGHPYLAYSLVGLGQALTALGRATEALPLLEEGLAIRASLPENHWALAEARYAKAYALIAQGRHHEAGPLLEESLESLQSRNPGDRHLQRAREYQSMLP